jgi:hypothetical protein
MCKEMPVILVNKVVDPKRIIRKKWRAEEEERHEGLLTKKTADFTVLEVESNGRHIYINTLEYVITFLYLSMFVNATGYRLDEVR